MVIHLTSYSEKGLVEKEHLELICNKICNDYSGMDEALSDQTAVSV